MRNAILSLYGLDVEIRPKWTSDMDPPILCQDVALLGLILPMGLSIGMMLTSMVGAVKSLMWGGIVIMIMLIVYGIP